MYSHSGFTFCLTNRFETMFEFRGISGAENAAI